MNLSVNGQSQVPPGFRFHPTEEELLHYYLRKKVASEKIDLDVIQDIDLNKLEPWDIQEKCRIGSTPQNDWYFFSHKDKKYPTGTRTNRATAAGFWKATGRDKVIRGSSNRIGMRKTLVFYKGRAPHGQKSDWIMHEYRLDDNTHELHGSYLSGDQPAGGDEGWVVCRVFRKKNYVKALQNPANRSPGTSMDTHKLSSKTHDLDQVVSAMGNTVTNKDESKNTIRHVDSNMDKMVPDGFMHLPQLNIPSDQPMISCPAAESHHHHHLNWVDLDRLVAYQLNGQATEASESTSRQQLSCFSNENDVLPFYLAAGDSTAAVNATTNTFQDLLRSQSTHVYDNEAIDDQLWSFTKQSSSPSSLDPLCRFSV